VASLVLAARYTVAFALVLAAVQKIRARTELRPQLVGFGVPVAIATGAGIALVVVELGVALALVLVPDSTAPAFVAVALLAVFSGAVLANLARDRRVPCPCFGAATSDEPISGRTVLRNGWLLALAVLGTGSVDGARGAVATAWTVALLLGTIVVVRWAR
jgi:hypothetical protein